MSVGKKRKTRRLRETYEADSKRELTVSQKEKETEAEIDRNRIKRRR